MPAAHIAIVDAAPTILADIPRRLGAYAARQLSRRGIEIHVNERLVSFDGETTAVKLPKKQRPVNTKTRDRFMNAFASAVGQALAGSPVQLGGQDCHAPHRAGHLPIGGGSEQMKSIRLFQAAIAFGTHS